MEQEIVMDIVEFIKMQGMLARLSKTRLKILTLLINHFKDAKKVSMWLDTVNPFLGGVSPLTMLECGREERLLEFIKGSLDENKRGET